MAGKNILVIPDAHAHPEYDNARFAWLGNYIEDTRPDVIVCLGDFADMASLSSYDEGKLSGEGRRYAADVEATLDAQEKLFAPLHRKKYHPKKFLTLGNHEYRIDRAVNEHPKYAGKLSGADLCFDKFGWTVLKYRVPLFYAGWAFCHHFPSGISGRPISGVNVARSLIAKNHMSSVVGHNHVLDFSETSRPDGSKVVGLSAGCYAHPDMEEGWNKDTNRMWWRGVVAIDGAKSGGYRSLRFVSMDELQKDYL